mmetsp:Transcript_52243/g.166390  ORF Transcript_52243/g.166390 Transcript_52243/m.166390 type:complete len:277 (-) Transcript_52243:1670-2500(-)
MLPVSQREATHAHTESAAPSQMGATCTAPVPSSTARMPCLSSPSAQSMHTSSSSNITRALPLPVIMRRPLVLTSLAYICSTSDVTKRTCGLGLRRSGVTLPRPSKAANMARMDTSRRRQLYRVSAAQRRRLPLTRAAAPSLEASASLKIVPGSAAGVVFASAALARGVRTAAGCLVPRPRASSAAALAPREASSIITAPWESKRAILFIPDSVERRYLRTRTGGRPPPPPPGDADAMTARNLTRRAFLVMCPRTTAWMILAAAWQSRSSRPFTPKE